MIFKANKDKENSKTERSAVLGCSPLSTAENKNRHYSNTAVLNMTLHSHNRILKLRRNSNFNPRVVQLCEMDTICAKKISLCENRERSKGKSCRSASSHYEKSILQESNFDLLK